MMTINMTETYKSLSKIMSEYADNEIHTEVYMNYEDAAKMVAEFIKSGYKLYSVNICDPEIDNYFEPYSVAVINDGEKKIFVEKCYCDGKAVHSDCDILFTIGEMNEDVIDACEKVAIRAKVEISDYTKDENEYFASSAKANPVRMIYAHLNF